MLAVSAVLPSVPSAHPPVVLIHGAANSALVWHYWQRALTERGWPSYALDLRGHGASDPLDLSNVGMTDYAADVARLAEQFARKPVLIGWSMGGLVAMMVGTEGLASACVCLAPSAPARRVDLSVSLRAGEFGPDEYGIVSMDPADQPAMPDLDREERQLALRSLGRESRRARDERQRGIVVASLPCPLLIVTGTHDAQWPASRYRDLWLRADALSFEGASHWGLVLNRRVLGAGIPQVVDWLSLSTMRSGWSAI